jgi:VanZ family protein
MVNIQSNDLERKHGLQVVWYWVPVAFYAGLIFYLSSQSYPEQYVPHFVLKLGDKALHAIEYALLGLLCYRAFRHAAGTWCEYYAVFLAVAAATIYGATDEWHQAFVPFRESDHWDLATDLLGACLGVMAWAWIDKRRAEGRRHVPCSIISGAPPDSPSEKAGKEATLEPEAR